MRRGVVLIIVGAAVLGLVLTGRGRGPGRVILPGLRGDPEVTPILPEPEVDRS